MATPAAVLAQTSPDPRRQEFDLLFRQLLANPANLDVNFRFAETATSLRDYEAAIGALERMLFYNPNLPRVRLELGVLYFRLGSYAQARDYFESAITGPDVPPDVVSRVRSFLTEIDRRLSTTQWAFFGQAGLRYQSNASAGPASPLVRALGVDAVLDRKFTRQPDWNAFALGTLRHVYDFENQRGDVWETNVSAYLTRQFSISRLNVGLVELTTGPRLALAPDAMPGSYVRPYLIANHLWLGNAPYLASVGAGVGVGIPVGSIVVEPFLEVRRRNFDDSDDYRTAKEQNGRLYSAGVLVGSPLFDQLRWQSRFAVSRSDTRELYDFWSYRQVSADITLPYEFNGPWGSRTWTVAPFVGFSAIDYDDPHPLVDPNVTRRDREWRVGTALDVPVWQNVGLGATASYSYTDSNLRNFRTRNFSVSFGPTLRF